MWGGADELKSQPLAPKSESFTGGMNNSPGMVETEHSFSLLLELAADNDVQGFKRSVFDESEVMAVGLWYGSQAGSRKMVLEQRTPLMVAAKYGSVDVVRLIISLPDIDVNFSCGPDKSTALHCACSGASLYAIDVVKWLLLNGADPDVTDANGLRPVDVVVVPPNFPSLKIALVELLKNKDSIDQWEAQFSANSFRSITPSFSPSSDEGTLSSPTSSLLSPGGSKLRVSSAKKEYPVDPSLPDIGSSIYANDEFRMFAFKIWQCTRAYSHDWTECPFVHPGENARRRDPRKFKYGCVPCPEHRKGVCSRGDLCEYAHGVFECWLHPAQYRTRFCKDGTSCKRRVCFFAHTSEELRPLYVPTQAAGASPQAATADLSSALKFLPGSPSAVSALSPSCLSSPMMSHLGYDSNSPMSWPQQNIPNSHMHGNNLQASRLRTSLNARDIPPQEMNRLKDFEFQRQQLLNEVSCHAQQQPSSPHMPLKTLNTSNLESKVSSAQGNDNLGAAAKGFSPSYNQLQRSALSPINTKVLHLKKVDHSLLRASFGSPTLGRMSTQVNEPISPLHSQQPATPTRRENLQLPFHYLSTWESGSKQSQDSWSTWHSCKENAVEKPDVSWVESVLKESPPETTAVPVSGTVRGPSSNFQSKSDDQEALPAWLEGLRLDQIVA